VPHTGGVISLDLALALQAAGVAWEPAPGDRFMVPDRDLDDVVFVVSDMVVEVRDTSAGPLLAFNGTTEWALDSLAIDSAVWLPREEQLRELLGEVFVSLSRLVGGSVPTGYAVTVRDGGSVQRYVEVSADAAYARAVLSTRALGSAG
jgi:hypothetical protein